MKNFLPRNQQAWMLAAALLASSSALHAAATDIAQAPPIATVSGVKPNLLFLLDDSGSMTWDHLPDNVGFGGSVGGGSSGWTAGMCRLNTSSNSSGSSISQPPSSPVAKTDCFGSGSSIVIEPLKESGVPYFAKEFNGIYYNPTITYSPPVNYDGTNTTYKSYNNSAGHLWNSVPDSVFTNNPNTVKNLTTGFPEQVFCNATSGGLPAAFDAVAAVNCRRNLMTNPTFASTTTMITKFGGLVANVNLPSHGCFTGDTVKVVNANANYNGTFVVTVIDNNNFQYTALAAIGAAGGTTAAVSACNIPVSMLSSSGTTATAVFPIPHGCVVGETIRVLGASVSGYNNGVSGNPATYTVASVPDERTLTYTTATGSLTAVEVTGNFIARLTGASSVRGTCALTTSNYSTAAPAAGGAFATTVPPLMQGFPQGIFNTHKVLNSNPHYFTIGANEYCTDENLTKCEAPVSEGAYTVPAFVRYCGDFSGNAASVADVNANPGAAIPFSSVLNAEKGCHRVYGLNSAVNRIWPGLARYGYFTRTDIVPGTPTYPKVSSRTDCAGAVGPTGCSYNEEMTNVANWYAYYRTRIHMVKSAASIAFKNLGSSFRVGFNSLNAAGAAQWLPVAPFDTAVGGQKSTWYNKLNAITASGGTPSRNALARIGRYYGGLKTVAAGYMTDDPIEASCQQNFVFFATDGFWTSLAGYGGVKLDGTDMGDQDCAACPLPVGHSGTIARPFLDVFNSKGDDNKGTLADVAYYYYNTDLRDATHKPTNSLGTDVTLDNVPNSTSDPAKWQHMTTFTMGLGLDSTLIYKPGYTTAGIALDYDAVVAGTKDWPAPVGGAVSAVDDLWHAAVNGHGVYFSARNPANVVSGIANSFAIITQRVGAVAAPATSNPNQNKTAGDNFLFNAVFTSIEWDSDIFRRTVDPSTGVISTTIDWTAQTQLDAKTTANSDTRTIYTFDSANALTHLRSFVWGNLTATEQGYFNGTSGGRGLFSQWGVLSPAQQSACDNPGGSDCGNKLVNYLRGQRGFETTALGNNTLAPDTGTNSLFRNRVHILGDIVNAESVFVRLPGFNYFDQGYSAFKIAQASRPGTLYSAANDGMLHAFDSNTGAERWAYIPTMVMPNMWNLADFGYPNNHLYFVDGTPVTGDICTSNCSTASATWSTILVGGLNAGGRGFYALNITDPLNPKALWELKYRQSGTCIPSLNSVPQDPVAANTFDDCDVGLSFGAPVITKRADGKWVVLVTSGYNNVSPGTGGGFLYVVDAVTGAILTKTATLIPNPPSNSPPTINAGNTTTPSGFTKISGVNVAPDNDNTTLRVYGGDLNGNLWRIDSATTPNTLAVSGNKATLLAILGTANALNTQGNGTASPPTGTATTVGSQSITTQPDLGDVLVSGVGTFHMVYVGTGRYLGTSDPAVVGLQSFYGIKDPLGTFAGYGVVHGSPNMVQQTMTEVVNGTVTERHLTHNTVDLQTKNGWFIDFDPGNVSPGERSYTDPSLALGILSFTTNAPNVNACDVGGKSYIYSLDYTTGGPLPANVASGYAGKLLDTSLASRVVIIRVGDQVIGIVVIGSNPNMPQEINLGTAPNPASGKRINWRELNF